MTPIKSRTYNPDTPWRVHGHEDGYLAGQTMWYRRLHGVTIYTVTADGADGPTPPTTLDGASGSIADAGRLARARTRTPGT